MSKQDMSFESVNERIAILVMDKWYTVKEACQEVWLDKKKYENAIKTYIVWNNIAN